MRITPLEIQSHRFGRRFGGFDPEEVEAFLRMVTEDYEALLKENEAQRSRIAQLQERVDALSSQEKLLQETLLNAQAMSEKMRESAEKECDVLLGAAEVRAEKIIDASHRRAARLAENIRELRGLRARMAESLRSVIETHLGLIDGLTAETADGDSLVDGLVDGKIAYLGQAKPRETRVAESAEDVAPAVPADKSGGA